jgi:uncharacterized membrane protein (DUF485 family)
MSAEIYKKVRANPRFAELEGKRSRFAYLLTAIVMASYYGMMMLVAFAPKCCAPPFPRAACSPSACPSAPPSSSAPGC